MKCVNCKMQSGIIELMDYVLCVLSHTSLPSLSLNYKQMRSLSICWKGNSEKKQNLVLDNWMFSVHM